jgi:hypothetical protein
VGKGAKYIQLGLKDPVRMIEGSGKRANGMGSKR